MTTTASTSERHKASENRTQWHSREKWWNSNERFFLDIRSIRLELHYRLRLLRINSMRWNVERIKGIDTTANVPEQFDYTIWWCGMSRLSFTSNTWILVRQAKPRTTMNTRSRRRWRWRRWWRLNSQARACTHLCVSVCVLFQLNAARWLTTSACMFMCFFGPCSDNCSTSK